MKPGHRYGEPAWAGDPSLPHSEADLATHIQSDESYEELKSATYVVNPWRQFVLSQTVNTTSETKLGGLSDMIKIIVGAQPVAWLIHQRPFLEICGFARSFLSWPVRGTNEPGGAIKLPYEDPAAFDLFVKYVYSGAIGQVTTEKALRLYTLAFRLQAPSLCEHILLTFQDHTTPFAPVDVQYIMSNTTLSDPLRLRCLLQVCHLIVHSRIYQDSFIAEEICNKYSSEIISFMIGRNDIGANSAANHFYTGVPFAIHVAPEHGRQHASSSGSTSVSMASVIQTSPTHPPPSQGTTSSSDKASANPFSKLPPFAFRSQATTALTDSAPSRVSLDNEATRESLSSSHANLEIVEIDTKVTPNARTMTSTSSIQAAHLPMRPEPAYGNQKLGSQSTITSSGPSRFTAVSGNFMHGSVASMETLPKSPISASDVSASANVHPETISSTGSQSSMEKSTGSTLFGRAQTAESDAPVSKVMNAAVLRRMPKTEAIPGQGSKSSSTPTLFDFSNSTAGKDPGFLRTVLTSVEKSQNTSLNPSNKPSPVTTARPGHNALHGGQEEAEVATNSEEPASLFNPVFKNK